MFTLQKTIETLCSQHMPKKKEKKESYSWFSGWRRKATDDSTAAVAGHPVISAAVAGHPVISETDTAASKSVGIHNKPHSKLIVQIFRLDFHQKQVKHQDNMSMKCIPP